MAERGDGIIRWCPNPAIQEFLTIGFNSRTVQTYKASGEIQPGHFVYDASSKHVDLPAITAYDWSPKINGLVAVGTKAGEVHLLRIDDDSNDSIVLPLKLQRSCQAVAFNTTGLLAVGLDRVRNDQCLQIWDINERLAKWDVNSKGWQSPSATEPLHKLEPTIAVSSAKFFQDQPQTLVVGIKNQGLRIHDLRDPNGAVVTFQSRCNNNLNIDLCDQNYFASTSLDQPTVMVFDRRAVSRHSSSKMYVDAVDGNEVSWGCVLKLNNVIDSSNETFIRSLRYCPNRRGLLGVLSTSGELQMLRVGKEYIETHSENDVDGSPELLELRRSHTIAFPNFSDDFGYPIDERIVSFDWITSGPRYVQPRIAVRRSNAAIDAKMMPTAASELHMRLLNFSSRRKFPNTRRGDVIKLGRGCETARLLSFHSHLGIQASSSSESPNSQSLSNNTSVDSARVSLDEEMNNYVQKHVEALAIKLGLKRPTATPAPTVVAESHSTPTTKPVGNTAKAGLTSHRRELSDIKIYALPFDKLVVSGKPLLSSREQHEEYHKALIQQSDPKYSMIGDLMIDRIKDGYLFDYKKNRRIVRGNPWLQDVWTWVEGARIAAQDDGMVSKGFDLSYMGIHSIWTKDLGLQPKKRVLDGNSEPTDYEWAKVIEDINLRAGRVAFDDVVTAMPHQRQLCLATCGWAKDSDEFENELRFLMHEEEYAKGAAFALFERYPERAAEILFEGGPQLMFLGLALQGRLKNAPRYSDQELKGWGKLLNQHEELVNNPYIRAIYVFITTGKWKTIAEDESLPLRDRACIALRNFPDEQLGIWLDQQTQLATTKGDIEGIALTGITDKCIELMKNYIEIFDDIQTANLVMAHSFPLYVDDPSCWIWRKEYQALHNVNKLYISRCHYDVATTKLSRKRDGTTAIKPPPRQITIRCVHCDSSIINDIENTAMDLGAHDASHTHPTVQGPSANPLFPTSMHAGISCPRCGRHLPRCAVCLMTLGMPRSTVEPRPPKPSDPMANFLTFCLKCDHACHADHSAEWFRLHNECPIPTCHCHCNEDEPARPETENETEAEQATQQ